ncbi:kinesin-like protein KIN-14I [Heracleum sosnowskyi]|uniref:Kinesin-like protein KIN-14I n=1 Tax=Heracleum sosnowskyi TaxID=360622 RepID=A0AAD8NA96_9APIA|nr:kinesin-like protein KIN-14I [Heracleum sosnowskyi]
MASEGIFQFSISSVVGDVLQQHGKQLGAIDLQSRKANEEFVRRNEATQWLRKMIGVVAAKDLPAQPSEEEFRSGLRSGIILCKVLNKIQPQAASIVIEAPADTVIILDAKAKSAARYQENVKNFLLAVDELGIPTFELADLDKGGNTSSVVDTVLAMKSYFEWKERGAYGTWKYGENLEADKQGPPKSSELPIRRSLSRMSSGVSLDSFAGENIGLNPTDMDGSWPLHIVIRDLLSDKKKDEIPIIVENMLHKVTEEFEQRIANQKEQMKQDIKDLDGSYGNESIKDLDGSYGNESISSPGSDGSKTEDKETSKYDCLIKTEDKETSKYDCLIKTEDKETSKYVKEEYFNENYKLDDGGHTQSMKQLIEHHHQNLKVLKHDLYTTKADMQNLQMKYQDEVHGLGEHLHSLAHAASGYRKVLEENRKLYNEVQDLKGSIRVYCRARPFLPGNANQGSSAIANIDNGKITLITPTKTAKDGLKSFSFNQVFSPSATQEEVFSDMRPLVQSVLDGYNVCIFAYGQTGSGKTYTMSGPNDLTEETLEIRNNSQNGLNVPDANLVPVSSKFDVINLMNLGQKNRAVGSTAMNDRSSRSHSCLNVHVQARDLTSGSEFFGCMNLVDLAGSERADKTEAVGERLKEATYINKSLSALGDVLSALAQKTSHVPYRNSKLTQLLQDSLGGQAKTLMFVHISPEIDAIGETISTLKFAERVSTVELGASRANKDSSDVKELKEQIAKLKASLAKKESENLQQSKLVRMMSAGASISSSNSLGGGNTSSEEDGNSKENTSAWPSPVESPQLKAKPDSGKWVDKIVLNKQNPKKIYPEQPDKLILSRSISSSEYEINVNRYDVATTTDESDIEAAASDNSEPDFSKTKTVAVLGSKIRSPAPRQARTTQIRTPIPPQPSTRKQSNGARAGTTRTVRQVVDTRRKQGSGK